MLVVGAGGLVGGALAALPGVIGLPRGALDITDRAAVEAALDRLGPAALINAAAQARVDAADQDPLGAEAINALAPGALAAACARRGLRCVHLSTDYALNGPDEPGLRLDEAWPADPRSVYAATKRRGEEAALAEGAVVVRVQWVYAPTGASFLARCLAALREGQRLRLVTDQVGSPTPVSLLAPALLRCALGGPGGLFHLACGGEATPYQWVQAAADLAGLPFQAEATTRAALGGAFRPARSCLDSDRFAQAFGLRLPDWRLALAEALSIRGRSAQTP